METKKIIKESSPNWRDWYDGNLGRLGDKLAQKQRASEPVELYVRKAVSASDLGMPKATAICALKAASGQFGDDATASLLMNKIPHSVLARMEGATARQIASKRHTIRDVEAGCAVTKTLAQMTKKDIRENVRWWGMKPLTED